jgi:hypothetical protein
MSRETELFQGNKGLCRQSLQGALIFKFVEVGLLIVRYTVDRIKNLEQIIELAMQIAKYANWIRN